MNQSMNNPTGQGGGGGFPSQPGSQTNPFTADLKGEFASNFGTNTNAMSQIFKEGSYSNQSRSRVVLLGILVVALVAFGALYFYTDESVDDEFAPPAEVDKPDNTATASSAPAVTAAPGAPAAPVENTVPAGQAAVPAVEAVPADAVAAGPVSINFPDDGSTIAYDETTGPARFSWSSGGGKIEFSKSSSMRPVLMSIPVKKGSYSLHQPAPGTWYWRVKTAGGQSEVRSFTVEAPARRKVALTAPASGGAIAGSGGQVTWQGDSRVTFYRVELNSGQDWANPNYKFSTAGSVATLQGVTPGGYKLRVGAFSEISGRWEYTTPVDVTIQ
jgi:hypothetical protein